MSGLGTVTLGTIEDTSPTFSFDESVGCMLFDYGLNPNAFDNYPVLQQNFGDEQLQEIGSMEEALQLGLSNNGFMNGVPYYHLSKFFSYAGNGAKVYVVFAKCVENYKPNYNVLEAIQRAANGKIFQLGLWTEYSLWERSVDGNYQFTSLLTEIQSKVNDMVTNHLFPMNIIVNAGVSILKDDMSQIKELDYNKIPDATQLNLHNISVVLGQNGTDEIHTNQMKNVNYAPFGLLGYAMACLYLAPAEMSIGYVKEFDLNKNDDLLSPELGFGKIIPGGSSHFTLMEEINRVRKNIIAQKGYIIPISYQAKEQQVFFCNDQTLSDGDYKSIANNRVMGKCRRVIYATTIQNVRNDVTVDSSGQIDSVSAAQITSKIISNIDLVLVNEQGQSQIQGRNFSVDSNGEFLNTDEITIYASIIPASSSSVINMKDSYPI